MSAAREPIVKTGDVLDGRYRILKTLGEGGMGTVFLAEHTLIKRRVALKLLHPELATDADVVERFMNEARAAGTLGHPNIVESTDMGFTGDRVPYIVFEFLEGALLTDEIYRVGGFTVRRAVRIAQQIASALHAAHVANIVHRDLKSDNVFLTDKDESLDHVKVLDFGISRFLEIEDENTRRGIVMGTPEFMAPEQITAPDQVDRRADIYALGVILYEMLTARRPFSSDEDPRALLTRIVNTPPPPLGREDVPHALGELIVNKMLAKDPADRYPTMIDVEAALSSYTTRAEAGGLRRGRPTTLPSITPPAALIGATPSTTVRRPTVPRPSTTAAPPWQQGRPDTDDHLTTAAMPHASPRKSWLLYGVAGMGVVVGALGLVIGTRSSREPAQVSPPVAIAPPPVPAVAVVTPPRTVSKLEIRLDADAPGARVTFRRRVTEAPATFQINPSEIVELVEVAAPGYKTERYWLTFDRPTRLTARMTKGDGLAEATEEETLIALGELAPPAPAVEPAAEPPVANVVEPAAAVDAATPAAPVVAAAPIRHPVPKPVVRRKIGRAIAAKQVVAAIEPDPVVAAPAALDGDPVPQAGTPEPAAADPVPGFVAAPAPSPDLAPAAAEPASPDLAKADPGAPSADPAKPLEAAKPTEAMKPPEPAKPVEPSAVTLAKARVAAHRLDIEHCVAQGRVANKALAGTVRLELQIGGDGRVKGVQPHASFQGPPTVSCIVKAASSWTFPEHAAGDVVTVIFTVQ